MSEASKEVAKEKLIAEVGDIGLPEDLAIADLYGLIARFFRCRPTKSC